MSAQRVAEGQRGAAPREPGPNVSEAKAAFLPSLNLNFLYTPSAGVAAAEDSGGCLRPERTDVPREPHARERHAARPLAAALHAAAASHTRTARRPRREEAKPPRCRSRARQALSAAGVREAFYAALMNDQGIRVSREGVHDRRSDISSWRRSRFEAGSAARLDVLRAEVELANAKAKLIRARSASRRVVPGAAHGAVAPAGRPLRLAGTLDEIPACRQRRRSQDALDGARRHPRRSASSARRRSAWSRWPTPS